MRNVLLAPTCLLALFSIVVSQPGYADTLSRIRDTQTIILAHRESSIPFSYLDENKKPQGYALDLCLKIADAVKRELKLPQLKVQYLLVSSANRIAAITEGRADLECGSTTNNAERRQQVAFTIPHFISGVRMLVRTDSGIRNWTDLRNKRVITTRGTTTVQLLNDRSKARSLNLALIEGKDHDESFKAIQTNAADAFPMDDVLLYGLRAMAAKPDEFKVVGDQLSIEPYAIMMRKDDPAFKAIADREMSRMIHDGEFEKSYDKWFRSAIPPKGITMNMPMGFLLRESMRYPTDKVAD
jgi:ABC-type amino acid transport substrate-binding protein